MTRPEIGAAALNTRENPGVLSLPLRPEDALVPVLVYLVAAMLISALLKALNLTAEAGATPLRSASGEPETSTNEALRLTWIVVAGNVAQLAGLLGCVGVVRLRCTGGLAGWVLGTLSLRRQVGLVVAGTVGAFAASYPAYWLTQRIIQALVNDYVVEPHRVVELLRQGTLPFGATATLWMGAVIVAPVCEEAFFRGILQAAVHRWLGPSKAIIVSAICFGAAHSQWHTIPPLILLGAVLGILYQRSGSLVPPVIVHALFNLATLLGVSLGWS